MSIDEFIVRMSQWSPGFSERIRGAAMHEIQELAELVGFPLPVVHEQFLARMGHGDGGLSLSTDGSLDITDIINRYRMDREERLVVHDSERAPPADCIILETGGIDSDLCLQVVPGREPRVVYASTHVLYVRAETFIGCLGRMSFSPFRHRPLAHHLFYTSSYLDVGRKYVLGAVRQVFLELGFVEEWFSDSVSFCGEREGVVVSATQFEGLGLSVYVSSPELRTAEAIGVKLSREFNIKRDS